MPESRTQDVAIKAPPTRRETLGNMLKDIRFETTARPPQGGPMGMGVEGRVGPVEYRVMKNLGQTMSAGARVRLGPTEWDVDRKSDGTFAAKVNVTLPLGRRRR